jgi:hypothetical protein
MWANQGRRPGQLPPSGQPLSSLRTLPFSFYYPFNPTRCGQTRGGGWGNCLLQVSLFPPLELFLFFYYPFNPTRCGQTSEGGRGNCLLQVISSCPPFELFLFLPIIPLNFSYVCHPPDEGACALGCSDFYFFHILRYNHPSVTP